MSSLALRRPSDHLWENTTFRWEAFFPMQKGGERLTHILKALTLEELKGNQREDVGMSQIVRDHGSGVLIL